MRRQATPILVPNAGISSALGACDLRDNSEYDEAWIQALIHEHPNVLPISDIEPAFWPAVPVCKELALPSGNLDNFLITPAGNLIFVECKLWRNPQARREVVAQIIDYAKDLKRFDYATLEANALKARGDGNQTLYEMANPEIDEHQFVDTVSRNLRLGRALLIIAGDGITESVEAIADYLQQHAGIHFTFALVQLSVYNIRDGGKIVVPSIPMLTTNIVRGIVEVRDGKIEIAPAPDTAQSRRATTLTEQELFAELDALKPGTSERLLALVEAGKDTGLHIIAKKTLIVRLPLGENYANLLVISPNLADTAYIWWLRDALGEEIIRQYFDELAGAIPGSAFWLTPKGGYLWMPIREEYLKVWDILDHADAWLAVIRRFREAALQKSMMA